MDRGAWRAKVQGDLSVTQLWTLADGNTGSLRPP